MGLFSKTSKPNPKITTEGIEIVFDRNHEWWKFTLDDIEFCSFESTLILPTKADLYSILKTVAALLPEMSTQLTKGLREWGEGSKLDDGESYFINVQEFVTHKRFTVSWSGGQSWGDLSVEFLIKDHAIADESWGD